MINTKKDIAAFIDLDGTLCDIFLYQALFRYHHQFRFNRVAMYKFIVFHMPLWLLFEAHLLSRDFLYQLHATNLAWLVDGVTIERGEQIWEWVIENELIPDMRPEMLAAIEGHKRQGHRIVLSSGSFAPLLDKLALRLGFERVIATPWRSRMVVIPAG